MAQGFPSLNVTVDQLRRMASHGAAGPTQGNVSPSPPGMRSAAPAMGGATAGVRANPSRVGMPPVSAGAPAMGSAQPPARGGAPMGMPTPQSVRTHALAIGGLKHAVAAGHIAPHHARAMEAKSRAHIAAYSASKGAGAAKPRGGFGALGGAGGGLQTGGGILSTGGPSNIPGAAAGAQGTPPVMEE